jgi:hypothetical protein
LQLSHSVPALEVKNNEGYLRWARLAKWHSISLFVMRYFDCKFLYKYFLIRSIEGGFLDISVDLLFWNRSVVEQLLYGWLDEE